MNKTFIILFFIIGIISINLYSLYKIAASEKTSNLIKQESLGKYNLVKLTAKQKLLIEKDIQQEIAALQNGLSKFRKLFVFTYAVIIITCCISIFL